jgi:hypothetical protein
MATDLSGYGSLRHLAGRWASSLWPGGPGVADDAWARRWLSPAEKKLWDRMSGPDRRHAVGVARAVAAELGNADGTGVATAALAAALLHDVGKVESGFGTNGRAVVTVVAIVAGRERVASWAAQPSGIRARAGRYVTHDRLGAELLTEAASDPLVVSWARQHHLPPTAWSVEPGLGEILKRCDND